LVSFPCRMGGEAGGQSAAPGYERAGSARAHMTYAFDFSALLTYSDELLMGAWLTIRLTVSAIFIGLVIAVAGALGKTAGSRPIRIAISVYVEIIRNTPFLVQIFIVFFGLPSIGLRMSADTAALVAMSVNVGAYAIE